MAETALITVEKLDIAVVFSDDGMDKILKEVEAKALSLVPDLETESGRKDISSMAHKVARSKTLLDDLGKDLVSDWKQKAKRIDGYRKTARDFLDELKDRVRKPLSDWEAIEAEKKAEEGRREKEKIEKRIADLAEFNVHMPFFDVAAMADDVFDITLVNARLAYADEQKRLADEEAARKAESNRLEIVRKEQETMAENLRKAQREIEEANAKIEAEKKAFEDEKKAEQDRKDREAFEKQTAENARIKAEKDAKEKAERETAAKIEAEKRTKAEAERQEALKPDKDRLVNYGKALMDVPRPALKDKNAKEILEYATGAVYQILKTIAKKAKEL